MTQPSHHDEFKIHLPPGPDVTTLMCFYCAQPEGGRVKRVAQITIHDRRRCEHVCFEHAKQRLTRSFIFGHSTDCAHRPI